jgi:hypothetical protein
VVAVSGKDLVGALAALDDFEVPGDRFGEQEKGCHIMARHRFGHRCHGTRDGWGQVRGVDVQPLVAGPEGFGNQVRVLELVASIPACAVEPNAERGKPVLALLGQQRNQQARIQPSGQKDTYRHVGHHPPSYCRPQRLSHRLLPVPCGPARVLFLLV